MHPRQQRMGPVKVQSVGYWLVATIICSAAEVESKDIDG